MSFRDTALITSGKTLSARSEGDCGRNGKVQILASNGKNGTIPPGVPRFEAAAAGIVKTGASLFPFGIHPFNCLLTKLGDFGEILRQPNTPLDEFVKLIGHRGMESTMDNSSLRRLPLTGQLARGLRGFRLSGRS